MPPSPSLPLAQEGTRTGRQQQDPPWFTPWGGSNCWLLPWTALHLPCATSHEITSFLSPALELWPAHGGECGLPPGLAHCPAAVRRWPGPSQRSGDLGERPVGHWTMALSGPQTGEKSQSSQRPREVLGQALCSGSCSGGEESARVWDPDPPLSWILQKGSPPRELGCRARTATPVLSGEM